MDRLTEMEAFATVVDQGGFTAAARKLGISKSGVSKLVSALEARLGTRLLNRTTRRVSPTDIGLVYHDRARRVVSDAAEADSLVTAMQSEPWGTLRMTVPTDFGVTYLSGMLGQFMESNPQVTVNMVLKSRSVELISEGFDMAVRIGELESSSLRARRFCQTTQRLVASPDYLGRYGRPARIDDLTDHRLLHYSTQATGNIWRKAYPFPSGEHDMWCVSRRRAWCSVQL